MTSISVAVQGALGSACRLIHMCAQAAPSESHEAHVPTSRRSLRDASPPHTPLWSVAAQRAESPRRPAPGAFRPGWRPHSLAHKCWHAGRRSRRAVRHRACRRDGTRRYTILPQLTTPPRSQRERHFKGALRRPLFERRSWLRVLSTTCRPQGVARCWRRETRARGPACGRLTRIAHALAATGTVLARPAPSTDGPAWRCARTWSRRRV